VLQQSKPLGQRVKRMLIGMTMVMFAACGKTSTPRPQADPANAVQVDAGRTVYTKHCANCHGARLEGQPDWRQRMPNGRLPAPPHDDSGHTWHHSDEMLFGITKNGLVPDYAPPDYQSDMPAFGGRLSDNDIWAVLAFIKSRWSPEVVKMRAERLQQAQSR
jgi:mono/diheme cytochrome c family protein